MALVRCSRCRRHLPESGFHKRSNNCRECQREFHRARYSTEHDDEPRDCMFCGSSFRPKQRNAAVFCSRACKDKARREAQKAARIASKKPRSCEFCGDVVTPAMRSDARFCSEQCNERAHKVGRRRFYRDSDSRLRSIARLVERDGFLCGICLDPLDFEAAWPDPASVSFDHIAPLSLGGSNAESNLRLTHLACNCSRKNRE